MSDLSAFDLEPGGAVGGYELLSRLGSGAMGSVWKVKDEGGQIYAMKMLRDSLAEDDGTAAGPAANPTSRQDAVTARERLRREAMALRKVNHPGVCGIVDMELDDALAFIVTEFIEGKTLREDVATNGRYTGDDLERLAAKLIDAVQAVHNAGIVHRDIKPTNVMIAASGPVLVDFGIAMGEGESHVTRTGLVMGTPGFIAPEIIDGAESTETTDWWSLASVLGFAATGRPVFGVKPMMAVLEREASGNADLSGLPPTTMNTLRAALSPDPARRPKTAEILHAITLDALNPEAWLEPADDETTVVRPFDRDPDATAKNPSDSPRRLWDNETRVITPMVSVQSAQDAPATQVLSPSRHPDSEGLEGDQTQSTTILGPTDTATALLGQQTAPLLAHDTDPDNDFSDDSPTIAAPSPPPAAIPPNRAPSYRAAPAAPVAPVPLATPDNPEPSNPLSPVDATAVERGEYHASGTVAMWLLTVPMAMLGSCAPIAGLVVFVLIVWLFLAVGHNTEAQLEREWRRGGARKTGDWIMRAISLPWHLLCELPLALVRLITPMTLMAAAIMLGALPLQLPRTAAVWHWQGRQLALPLLLGSPLSYSGLLLAAASAISWLLTAFGPHSLRMCLGAGTIRGRKMNARITDPTVAGASSERAGGDDPGSPFMARPTGRPTRHNPWHMTLLALWLIVCAALLTTMFVSWTINWAPLTVAFA